MQPEAEPLAPSDSLAPSAAFCARGLLPPTAAVLPHRPSSSLAGANGKDATRVETIAAGKASPAPGRRPTSGCPRAPGRCPPQRKPWRNGRNTVSARFFHASGSQSAFSANAANNASFAHCMQPLKAYRKLQMVESNGDAKRSRCFVGGWSATSCGDLGDARRWLCLLGRSRCLLGSARARGLRAGRARPSHDESLPKIPKGRHRMRPKAIEGGAPRESGSAHESRGAAR